VLPYSDELWMDTEDSVSVVAGRVVGRQTPPRGREGLRVAVVRLPRISNSTDVEALACEPGVAVRWVTEPADVADADVVVLPGSKATVADLDWLRAGGLAEPIAAHAAAGRPVLGICGGFQMLCRHIDDPVESRAGRVDGLGLVDADIAFAAEKTLRHWETPLHGYEIHHGQVVRSAAEDWAGIGVRRGAVFGTHWHGLFDNDAFRRTWLTEAAAAAGRTGFVVAEDVDVSARRDAQLDVMADLLQNHLDVDAVLDLIDTGPPPRPTVTSGLRS
jgi:adenosylcobyric acid synthase